MVVLSFFIATPFTAIWVLPHFYNSRFFTAYQFLEERFHLSVRLLASGLFIGRVLLWLAAANSFCVDFLARKTGRNHFAEPNGDRTGAFPPAVISRPAVGRYRHHGEPEQLVEARETGAQRWPLSVGNTCSLGKDRQWAASADEMPRFGDHGAQALGTGIAHHRDCAVSARRAAPAGNAEQLFLAEGHRLTQQSGEIDGLEEALVLERIERGSRRPHSFLAHRDAEDVDHTPAVKARPGVRDRASARRGQRQSGDQ